MKPHWVLAAGLLWVSVCPGESLALPPRSSRQSVEPSIGQQGKAAESKQVPDVTDRPVDQSTSGPAEGAAVPDYQGAVSPNDRSPYWDGARMVLTLGVVLVLLGLMAGLVRRFPGLAGRRGVTGGLRLLGRLPLSPKEAICLVQVGTHRDSEVLVVGVTPGGVTLLHRVPAGTVEAAPGPNAPDAPARIPGTSSAWRYRALMARVQEVQAVWGLDRKCKTDN